MHIIDLVFALVEYILFSFAGLLGGVIFGWFLFLFVWFVIIIFDILFKIEIKLPFVNEHTPYVNEGEETTEFAFFWAAYGGIFGFFFFPLMLYFPDEMFGLLKFFSFLAILPSVLVFIFCRRDKKNMEAKILSENLHWDFAKAHNEYLEYWVKVYNYLIVGSIMIFVISALSLYLIQIHYYS